MKKLKMMLATLMAVTYASMPVAAMAGANHFAQGLPDNDVTTGVCNSISKTFGGDEDADCTGAEASEDSIYVIIKTIINIFSIVVGAVSVIMIILGGFRYITSGGDSNGVTSAKNTILYAIVGLVIVLFAQVIVQFVIARLNTSE